jgi:hypothetical protein
VGFFHVEVEGPEVVQWLNMDIGKDFQALAKNLKGAGSNRVETDTTTPSPSKRERTGYKIVVVGFVLNDIEESAKNRVFGIEHTNASTHAIVLRSVEDNIEESLL